MRAVPASFTGTSQHPPSFHLILPATTTAVELSSFNGQEPPTPPSAHEAGTFWMFATTMNDNTNGSSGITPDTTIAQTNGYADAWAIQSSPYNQSPYHSPMNEYNNWAGYMPHGLPSEQIGRLPHHGMSIPPTPQPHHQMGHQQLPMLNTQWPSQLTNPTPSGGSYSAPPLSNMTPVSSASTQHSVEHVPQPKPPPASASDKVRKTLSAEQKRSMCQYHEANPNMRQADIGKHFGVERSTVSKVLRNKDQYLRRDSNDPEPESSSAKRLIKGKADFERTLGNYISKQLKNNQTVSDEDILEKGTQFARASGVKEPLTTSWLAKFKQKYSLGGQGVNRLLRRASETNIPDSVRMTTTALPKLKKKSSSGIVSPASPTGQMSPLSEGKSDEDGVKVEGLGLDFNYRPTHSQSTTSLTDPNNSSFSGGVVSPTGTFTFSPDPNGGGFPLSQHIQGPDTHHREKRSNTFPSLGIDAINAAQSLAVHEPSTPRHPSTQGLESPTTIAPFNLDQQNSNPSLTSPPPLRRSSSNSSITGRPSETSPVSPSAEDARRAANTLMSYMQSSVQGGTFDQADYLMVLQMAKKLQVNTGQQQQPQQQQQHITPGGLQRIPEGDGEHAHAGLGEVKMQT